MHRLSHIKKVVFVKFQGKKDIIFRWPIRKRSTEISKAIFLLQNPVVCLNTSHSEKRVKGKSLQSLSAKWRFSFVIDHIRILSIGLELACNGG